MQGAMTAGFQDGGVRRRRVEALRRRALLKDFFVSQGKLLVDAFKDLLLGPVSLGAAVLDLITVPNRRRGRFAALMRAGRDVERRINLFGDPRRAGREGPAWTVDDLVDRFEVSLREQSADLRLNTAAKQALERTLAGLRQHGEDR
jgi:hypothetical protein